MEKVSVVHLLYYALNYEASADFALSYMAR
jgi:hypothetical protein